MNSSILRSLQRQKKGHWLKLAALGFLLATFASLTWPAAVRGQGTISLPPEAIANAQLAVVRLVMQYADQATSNQAPELCTGIGTLIGTTGAGGNARTFIVTDARIINATRPCAGAMLAYAKQFGAMPTAWKLDAAVAYLNATYAGEALIPLALDISASALVAPASGPIAVPLKAEPAYDLPVIALAGDNSVPRYTLDLGNPAASGQPYTLDAVARNALPAVLTPLQNSATAPTYLPTPTATSAPTVVPTGTVAATPTATVAPPTATPVKNPPPTATATALVAPSFAISPGAPILNDSGDGTGEIVGIVVQMPTGGERIAGPQLISAALNNAFAVSRPSNFSQHWHRALRAFYSTRPSSSGSTLRDPQFEVAVQEFTYLQQQYTDFRGVDLWLNAAKSGTTALGAVAPTPTVAPPPTNRDLFPANPIKSTGGLITVGIALIVLLLGLFFWGRALTAGRRGIEKQTNPMLDEDQRPDTARLPTVPGANSNGSRSTERRADPDDLLSSWRLNSLRPTVPLPMHRKANRLGLHAAGVTDPGKKRKLDPNQDTILALHGARIHDGKPQTFGLFVVADGMGGHQNGREASIHAIEVLVDTVVQPLVDGSMLSDDALLELLKSGVEKANLSLHRRNLRQHADMGTTITAALVTGDMAHLANVGDSRIYHLQTAFPLRQITVDHSVVAGLVAAGVIRPDEIYTHPKRNQIFRSLGEKEEVDVDTFRLILQPHDLLLLCSDGLWEMVRDPRIEAVLRSHPNPQELASALIDEANQNGGVDNISAVIVKMLDEQLTPQQTGMHIYAGPPSLIGKL